MGNGTTVAIVGGAAIATAAVLYLVTQKAQGGTGPGQGPFILQSSVTPTVGGTINPAPSPSGVTYPSGTVLTVTVTPNSGYTIGEVLEDGISIGALSTFQVTMNMSHTVNVIFYKGGVPPPSTPVQIVPLNTPSIWGYYGVKITLVPQVGGGISTSVRTCDEHWNFGNWTKTPMQFKVIDSNGQGVSKQKVQLYPGQFPDISKYKGYIILNDQQLNGGPLTVETDQDGIATVNLSYFADTTDHYEKLCTDANISVGLIQVIIPVGYIVWDGVKLFGTLYNKTGHGITGQTPAMGNLITNTIIAKIPNTTLQTQGLCYCGFNIKIL